MMLQRIVLLFFLQKVSIQSRDVILEFEFSLLEFQNIIHSFFQILNEFHFRINLFQHFILNWFEILCFF